jgi:23S rRNA (cytidine1920-2'-O)/16S rRNA (cytidine1409-2'-O)-methyltransferase
MEQGDKAAKTSRLDLEMQKRGVARSRSSAADLIKRGKVSVNGKLATKPALETKESDEITLSLKETFVSRAGEKLAQALDAFGIDPTGKDAVDIGSSTGGFTDCLLQRGAKRVVAIDVGTGQLDPALKADPRVELYEETDVRSFSLASPVDLAVIDVSFISLETILPKAYEFLKPKSLAVALVKPQFEVGKEIADKHKGVITDEAEQKKSLEKIKAMASKAGFKLAGETVSPVEGEKGNREFLLCLTKPAK